MVGTDMDMDTVMEEEAQPITTRHLIMELKIDHLSIYGDGSDSRNKALIITL